MILCESDLNTIMSSMRRRIVSQLEHSFEVVATGCHICSLQMCIVSELGSSPLAELLAEPKSSLSSCCSVRMRTFHHFSTVPTLPENPYNVYKSSNVLKCFTHITLYTGDGPLLGMV